MHSGMRSRLRGLRGRLWENARRTSPRLLLKIFLCVTIFLPWLAAALVLTWIKMARWRKRSAGLDFLTRHSLAFQGLDFQSLRVESKSGGLSNANQIWHLTGLDGRQVTYFVKVFVAAGSFWARHLPDVSPFPRVYGQKTHERFTVDVVSRVQLADEGVPVPKLVAFDAVEKVMVIEYLTGESVDEILKRIQERGRMEPHEADVIRQCGQGLAAVHKAGFSLIDTQPVNCIWRSEEKKVYFTDLEFCTREDRRSWDVGFFLCFVMIRLPEPVKREAREFFLLGYENTRALNHEGIAEAGRSLAEFMPVLKTILDFRQFTPEELLDELVSAP
ncbi:MAG: hypothetical protein FGM27_07680 [Candidatus Omnitrophica bacterium]|nr:hypothetical protein [Candidatus Omnitrophota bacterium]